MVNQGRYAIGGWGHTKGRCQWSVEFWIEDVERFARERASHSPTAEFPQGLEHTFVKEKLVWKREVEATT